MEIWWENWDLSIIFIGMRVRSMVGFFFILFITFQKTVKRSLFFVLLPLFVYHFDVFSYLLYIYIYIRILSREKKYICAYISEVQIDFFLL